MRRAITTTAILPLFLVFLLTAPAAADDGTTIRRSLPDHHMLVYAHSHPEEAADHIADCPTMCPIPETHTVILVELWQETNGCPGLQRAESQCGASTAPPDTLIERVYLRTP